VLEYAFFVQTCELPEDMVGASAEYRGRVIASKLSELAEPLHQSLEHFDNGGWKVLSHDLLQADGSLVVSFLICRQRET